MAKRLITTESSTNTNLIESLVQGRDLSEAWPLFLTKYRRLLTRWCLHWGANSSEAEDVVQETMLKMHTNLGSYNKVDGSAFRCWLKTVAYHCWLDVAEERFGQATSSGDLAASRLLASEEAREDLQRLFDRLADEELIELACRNLRGRVEPDTWRCFAMTYFDELPGDHVAETLGISLNAVYLATSRLRKMLRIEIRNLESSY